MVQTVTWCFSFVEYTFSVKKGFFKFLHECIIEFIKRVGEKDKMRGFVKHLIGFPTTGFKKFINTGARMQDSIYHMTHNVAFSFQMHQNVTISILENATFLWTSTHNVTT